MKKVKLISAIIFTCLCVIMIIIAGTQVFKMNNTDISVKNKITVSSKVTNVVSQKYNSTVSGTIKNNTSKDFNNVTIIVNVKTKTLKHTGTLQIEISSLSANTEYQINKIFETSENFESVTEVKYKVNGLSYEISNAATRFNIISLLYFALAIVFMITAIYLFKSSRDVVVVQHVTRQAKTHEEILGDIIAKQQENESKRIELEQQKVNLDNVKLDIENKKIEKEKPIYCSYCGAKNESTAVKCYNCSGLLRKE